VSSAGPTDGSAGAPVDGPLDLLVIGSGVAGLSAAVRAARGHGLRVGVLTKGDLDDGSTRWAQGGVAAVLEEDPDSTDLHLSDTLAAGGGLCDADAVRVLVDEGPARVRELMELGAVFDRDPEGQLELAREGGHSMARVVHAGGSATGAEVERALDVATRQARVEVFERWFAFALLVEGGRCRGVRALRPDGVVAEVRAANVLLATGGAGQAFAVTTNPTETTGDGTAMALRAGVAVADVEFMQFHPTALHTPAMPRPLLTEALRGHGALLRGPDGERFVDELQPRDVVSRAETALMIEQGIDHVWLDATGLDDFAGRFPNIASELQRVGLDPTRDWLPVAPAAHYLSGGVVTDLVGASSLPGLWAAGEAACTGAHGANRLASNSLLEGLVFGPRVVEAIVAGVSQAEPTGAMRSVRDADGEPAIGLDHVGGRPLASSPIFVGVEADGDVATDCRPSIGRDAATNGRPSGQDVARKRRSATGDIASERGEVTGDGASTPADLRAELQRAMTFNAGVLRSAERLGVAEEVIAKTVRALGQPTTPAAWEVANLCEVGNALISAAIARVESRGAHTRSDFPDTDPAQRIRYIQR
jgi:L-aspartate oxidase